MAVSKEIKEIAIFRLKKLVEYIEKEHSGALNYLDDKDFIAGNQYVLNLGSPAKLLKIELRISYKDWKP